MLLLLFDLPMETKEERRAYGRLRKQLSRNGYVMLQESVYVRLLRNSENLSRELERLEKELPEGNVKALALSLRQFHGMRTLRGEPFPIEAMTADFLSI